jgi:hypothetical protein
MLARSVVPLARSRTKMSESAFVSTAMRFDARLWHATNRPSAEIAGNSQTASACAPLVDTLTRSVVPLARSRTKTS